MIGKNFTVAGIVGILVMICVSFIDIYSLLPFTVIGVLLGVIIIALGEFMIMYEKNNSREENENDRKTENNGGTENEK
mgnify:FL=1